ncbi:putative endoribonuclease L-PSP [Bosea sp. LC85]|nr:putative endoribonuclease L-PSP [Bosea sp. LC85]
MSGIETVTSPEVPAPAGHYAHAVAYKDLVFVSGQLAPRPDGSHTSAEPFAVQARQALANLLAILTAAGCARPMSSRSRPIWSGWATGPNSTGSTLRPSVITAPRARSCRCPSCIMAI